METYFSTPFAIVFVSISKWSGKIGLYTTTYTYGMDPEDSLITTKDIKFVFSLIRIQ